MNGTDVLREVARLRKVKKFLLGMIKIEETKKYSNRLSTLIEKYEVVSMEYNVLKNVLKVDFKI